MSVLVDLFPILVLSGLAAVAVLAIRLSRRLSRGTGSAGDLEPSRPEPVGQTQTPWEVRAIDERLRLLSHRPTAGAHNDLTATVNRLIVAVGLPPEQQLPLNASREQLDWAVSQIEYRLGLPPLTDRSPT
jgi:hypothetical protein